MVQHIERRLKPPFLVSKTKQFVEAVRTRDMANLAKCQVEVCCFGLSFCCVVSRCIAHSLQYYMIWYVIYTPESFSQPPQSDNTDLPYLLGLSPTEAEDVFLNSEDFHVWGILWAGGISLGGGVKNVLNTRQGKQIHIRTICRGKRRSVVGSSCSLRRCRGQPSSLGIKVSILINLGFPCKRHSMI